MSSDESSDHELMSSELDVSDYEGEKEEESSSSSSSSASASNNSAPSAGSSSDEPKSKRRKLKKKTPKKVDKAPTVFRRLKNRRNISSEEADDSISSADASQGSNFDENGLNVDDVEAIIEADELALLSNGEESSSSDMDSFIVDDDDVSALAKAINTRESRSTLATLQAEEKKEKKSSKKSKKVDKMTEWRENMEQRRIMRVERLRQLAEKNPKLAERLKRSATERKQLYGSKLRHHPLGLIGTLFFHQMVGVAWCLLREELPFKHVRGGILADEMGVGKTTEMLTLVAFDALNGYTSQKGNKEVHYFPPTLVACPNSLIRNWVNETRDRFESSMLQIVILNENYTKDWETTVSQRRLVEADLVIINYESLRSVHSHLVKELAADIVRHPQTYQELYPRRPSLLELDNGKLIEVAGNLAEKHLHHGFKTIWRNTDAWTARHFLYGYHFRRKILDECTHFKNASTKTFHSVLDIQAERIWALSGTPLENNMDELYSLMRVLQVDQHARSIGNIKRWHHLLRLDRSANNNSKSVNVPPPGVVDRIKKRFLNVLQLRREIQNTNAVDPLIDYTKRRDYKMQQAWDTFVDTRSITKTERALHRHGDAFIDDPMDDNNMRSAVYNRPLDELMQERLQNDDQDVVWSLITKDLQVPTGFYWYTRQVEFNKAYDLVDSFLKIAFDTSLQELSKAIQAARDILKERHLSIAVEPEDRLAIKESIEKVMNHEDVNSMLRGPINVSLGFDIPKPLLFVARMHPLEQAMYDSIVRPMDANKAQPMTVTSAFNTIIRARTCCADYRTVTGAPEKLVEWQGTLWNKTPEPTLDYTPDEREDQELYQADVVEQLEEIKQEGGNAKEAEAGWEKLPTEARRGLLRKLPARAATKALMLLRYLKAIPEDDKAVVFSDLVRFFPILKCFLESYGLQTVVVTGEVKSGAERDSILAQFKQVGQNTPRVLLASLKCLSQGQNLQVGNHVIIYSIWWNGAVEEQAKRRIARLGQMKKIYIVYLALIATIDELVMSKAGMKESMVSAVIGNDDGIVKTSANFTRPNVSESHLMTFECEENGSYKIPNSGVWETSIDELTALPGDDAFGKTFANIQESDLLSTNGRINRVNVAAVLTQREVPRAMPIDKDDPIEEVIDLTKEAHTKKRKFNLMPHDPTGSAAKKQRYGAILNSTTAAPTLPPATSIPYMMPPPQPMPMMWPPGMPIPMMMMPQTPFQAPPQPVFYYQPMVAPQQQLVDLTQPQQKQLKFYEFDTTKVAKK